MVGNGIAHLANDEKKENFNRNLSKISKANSPSPKQKFGLNNNAYFGFHTPPPRPPPSSPIYTFKSLRLLAGA